MFLGVLHRYVIGQVLRAFLMALLTLTAVIVLFMVMAEAGRQGLAPQVVLKLIPYIIPGTLPYTIPVALLFAVSVVYGRLASDNEIIAVKAAGCSAWAVLGPALVLAGAMSVLLIAISGEVIPRSNHSFKMSLFRDAEETFYLVLKREREFNNPRWPVFISVRDVDMQNRVLIGPTFKHRAAGAANLNVFDETVQADSAVIRFDLNRNVVSAHLVKPVFQSVDRFWSGPFFDVEYTLSDDSYMRGPDKRVQEMTDRELARERGQVARLIATERPRQAAAAGLLIAAGRLDQVYWPDIGNAYRDDARWKRKVCEIETESHLRIALAWGAFCFVFLGAPVGVRFAKRDFLSAFITCFVPIIVLYYPLVLAGINMGKEGIVGPYIVWAGDLVLLVLAAVVALPPVLRH